MIFHTQNSLETVRLGKRIGRLLQPGDVVALVGELGIGKTHLIKGLAAGAGIKKSSQVSSPSFTFVHEYPGKVPFYHIDLYRLNSEKEAEGLGLEEVLGSFGITAIEWADKISSWLPEERLLVRLSYAGEHSRSIEILGSGKHFEEILESLSAEGEGDPEEENWPGSGFVRR